MKIKGKVINRRDYRRGRLITRWWLSVSPSEILRVPEGPTVSKALFSNQVGLVELAIEVPPNNKMCTKLEIVQLEIVAEGEGRGEYSGQNLILLRGCKINTLKRVVHN